MRQTCKNSDTSTMMAHQSIRLFFNARYIYAIVKINIVCDSNVVKIQTKWNTFPASVHFIQPTILL